MMTCIKATRTGSKSIRFLGRTGENKAETMSFDCSQFVEDYGEGQAFLFFKRPVDKYAYPVVVEQNGAIVKWMISASDTAFGGTGELEIQWRVDGILAKSASYPVKIEESLPTGGEAPPDPVKPWVTKLLEEISNNASVNMSDEDQLELAMSTGLVRPLTSGGAILTDKEGIIYAL